MLPWQTDISQPEYANPRVQKEAYENELSKWLSLIDNEGYKLLLLSIETSHRELTAGVSTTREPNSLLHLAGRLAALEAVAKTPQAKIESLREIIDALS